MSSMWRKALKMLQKTIFQTRKTTFFSRVGALLSLSLLLLVFGNDSVSSFLWC
jgi:hypothetical protein